MSSIIQREIVSCSTTSVISTPHIGAKCKILGKLTELILKSTSIGVRTTSSSGKTLTTLFSERTTENTLYLLVAKTSKDMPLSTTTNTGSKIE